MLDFLIPQYPQNPVLSIILRSNKKQQMLDFPISQCLKSKFICQIDLLLSILKTWFSLSYWEATNNNKFKQNVGFPYFSVSLKTRSQYHTEKQQKTNLMKMVDSLVSQYFTERCYIKTHQRTWYVLWSADDHRGPPNCGAFECISHLQTLDA